MTTTLPVYNPPQSGGVGSLPSTRDYMNDVKASTDSLSARDDVLVAGLNAQEGAVATEATARAAGDAALAAADDAIEASVSRLGQSYPGRDSVAFRYWSSGTMTEIPDSAVTTVDVGPVLRMSGDQTVVSAGMRAVERRRIYQARFVIRRLANTPDPANDAVEVGLLWFDRDGNQLAGGGAETIVETFDGLNASDGPLEKTMLFSHLAGSYEPPPTGAVSCRPFVRRFGNVGADAVEVAEWRDVMSIVDGQTADFDARVAAIEGLNTGPRLSYLESINASPSSAWYATMADAVAASIPATAETVFIHRYFDDGPTSLICCTRELGAPDYGGFTNIAGSQWHLAQPEVTLWDFGARGDGSPGDGAAIQEAFDYSSSTGIAVLGVAGDYEINDSIVVKSNLNYLGRGARFIKNYVSAEGNSDGMFVNEHYGTTPTDGNIKMDRLILRDASSSMHGAFLSFVGINGVEITNVDVVKTCNFFTLHISGRNWRIAGGSVDTSGAALNSDGVHINQHRNGIVEGIIFNTQDDCIGVTYDPTTWTSAGSGDPSDDLIIANCTFRSTIANGVQISNGYNNVDPDAVSTSGRFRNIVVDGCTFRKTGSSGYAVNLTDKRSNMVSPHSGLRFSDCTFLLESSTTAAIIVNGNPDITDDANINVKNYNDITFDNCRFNVGPAGRLVYGGGCRKLVFENCDFNPTTDVRTLNEFDLYQIDELVIRGGRIDGRTSASIVALRDFNLVMLDGVRVFGNGSQFSLLRLDQPTKSGTGDIMVSNCNVDSVDRVIAAITSLSVETLVCTGVFTNIGVAIHGTITRNNGYSLYSAGGTLYLLNAAGVQQL